MTTAQIAERIIRRHRGEVLTLSLKDNRVMQGRFKVEPGGYVRYEGQVLPIDLSDIREVYPGPLTRQQIQEFYREHDVPQEARYA
jgi:hypothetical protein